MSCLFQIAEHVDYTDGFLSKLSLYKALALIALAQQGKQPSPKLLENCIQGKPFNELFSSKDTAVNVQLNQWLDC
jgi:sorting nexin-8